MKCLVVNIMPHGPAYHFAPHVRPDVAWEKPDGTWVGFWPREWPDLLGEAVLKVSREYEWEVWQPDRRADRIYSKTLASGVTHRLFPASEAIYRLGLRGVKDLRSSEMIARLEELVGTPLVLHLHGIRIPFYFEILNRFGSKKKFPIFIVGHGMFRAPASELLEVHRPVTYACLIAEQWQLRKVLWHVDVISEQAESALREIKRVYAGRIVKLTMGCDFDFWIPGPTPMVREAIRRRLHIEPGQKVFLASGNFIPRKRFQELIGAFREFIGRNDVVLVIAGHGDAAMTDQLASMIKPLEKSGRAILHPYVDGERLRDLYWAADVYVSVSRDEGSSVGIMKAMACGLPILTTPVGETSERLQRHGVGKFIPTHCYEDWPVAIGEILDKGLPEPLDRDIAQAAYDWPQVAGRFIAVYGDLCRAHFG